MSATLVRNKKLPSKQLSFSWMDSPSKNERENRLPASVPVTQPAIRREPQSRVGEARLGAVMLALLKRYGITDEEIATGLATATDV